MSRFVAVAALAVVLLAPPAKAEGPPAGLWKFRFTEGPETVTLLLSFTDDNGKWVGDFIGSSVRLKLEPKFRFLTIKGDAIQFTVEFGGREFINFDGVIEKDGKKITGSFTQFGGRLRLTELLPSKLKKLDDPFELARENLSQMEPGIELFDAGFTVAEQAATKKLPVEEVRGIAEKLTKAAAGYGPRWELTVSLRLANLLAEQAGFADVALAQARRAERLLNDDAPAATAIDVTETIIRALTAAGKADDAKPYQASLTKLIARDYAEFTKNVLGFVPEPFKGRKGKSDRAVLVEIFTGAECPPCAGVDLAADALLQAYKPTEVVMLQYHFHVPLPDPMTSPDGMDRVAYYADQIRGAPTILFNGKPGPEGGGPALAAKEKFTEYSAIIDPLLEKPATVKLAVTVAKAEKGYTAKATVADLETPGEKIALRFILAEERVRYTGGNGVRYHQHVVRAMPGGKKGFALTKKSQEESVTFDPAAIRASLTTYLDEYAKADQPFPRPDRPLALKGLKLIALIQDDATNEILQAVQVDVDGK